MWVGQKGILRSFPLSGFPQLAESSFPEQQTLAGLATPGIPPSWHHGSQWHPPSPPAPDATQDHQKAYFLGLLFLVLDTWLFSSLVTLNFTTTVPSCFSDQFRPLTLFFLIEVIQFTLFFVCYLGSSFY